MRCAMLVLAAAGVVVLSGCGGGSTNVVRPPTGSASSSAPSSTVVSSPPAGHPRITVVPADGLRDRQSVRVVGSGFSPDEALQVIQCAAKGQATGPGDCNLPGMLGVSSDAAGKVTATLAVVRGPFGANRIVCSARQHCLVSVTQASLQPTEEADAEISFAAP